MYKIMLSVGEASGDMNGASLAKALKSRQPDIRLLGMGGKLMAAAGVELVYDIAETGVMGIVEVIKKLPSIKAVMNHMCEILRQERPDALVVIDYPGFNMRLAKRAHDMGIPVIYYISPSAWAWHRSRAKTIAQTTNEVAAIFPFEAEVYQQAGAKVTFVGHPLIDIVKPELSRDEAYEYFSVDDSKPVLTLMPGSRVQEVEELLPAMLEAARHIKDAIPKIQVYLPVANTINLTTINKHLEKYMLDIKLTSDKTYDLMNISSLVIAASGTATLETAIIGTPMIIVYKVASLTWLLGKLLVKIPFIGLPNIVAGQGIVPELLQSEANPANIAKRAVELLQDSKKQAAMRADLAVVRQKLGEPGAVERAADVVLRVAENRGG